VVSEASEVAIPPTFGEEERMAKVMIAEDDLLLADMVEKTLVAGGYDVCGIARTVDEAVELAKRHELNLAILDIRLAEGGLGTDIPAQLKGDGQMGILYVSGRPGGMSLTTAVGHALLTKPFLPRDLLRAVELVEQIVRTGEATRPFPPRFYVLTKSSSG
jgi:DNA-binding response OmpR family regulator